MVREMVGTVASMWRYPVKSMLGEELEASEVTKHGLLGDRAYALLDAQSGRIASAKNPKKWAKLLEFHAAFTESPHPNTEVPPVRFSLPDGNSLTSEQADANHILSGWLGREVQLLSSVPEAASLDQYWPNIEGAPVRETVTQLFMPPATFFDSCSIHAITTATLASLQRIYPEGEFEMCRFRPNILIEPTNKAIEFVEDEWVGGILTFGEEVRLSIDSACPRCVVTTLAQSGLSQDLGILQTTTRHHNAIAGIRASVLQGGTIYKNDPIWFQPSC